MKQMNLSVYPVSGGTTQRVIIPNGFKMQLFDYIALVEYPTKRYMKNEIKFQTILNNRIVSDSAGIVAFIYNE